MQSRVGDGLAAFFLDALWKTKEEEDEKTQKKNGRTGWYWKRRGARSKRTRLWAGMQVGRERQRGVCWAPAGLSRIGTSGWEFSFLLALVTLGYVTVSPTAGCGSINDGTGQGVSPGEP